MRFSGFTDEWNEVKIVDISKSITKGTTPKKYSDTGINFVKVESIENNKIYKIDAFIDENTHKNELSRSILKTNDLLFSIAGSLGRTTIVTENILPANTNQALSIIRFYDNCNCNLKFIQSRLNTYDIAKYIFQNLAVGAQPNLNLQQVGNIKIRIPSFNEQNKIQGFLECVDIKIELLKKKYQYYQEFKKYLMQQIFTQKLRFNFTDDWNYMNFSEIFKSVSTKKYQIKSADILDKGDFEVIDQGQDEIAGYFNDKTKLCQELPIIIYGDHTTFVKFRDKPFIVGADGVKLLIPKFNANPKYLFYALEHFNIKPEGYKRHFSIIKKIKLPIPTLEEQNEISEIFTYIDIKLKYTKIQLQETEEFKKGLLQQMFVVQLILSLLQNKKHI